MEKVLYAEVLAICMLVLFIVWQNDVNRSRGPSLIGQNIFRILIWVNIGAMFCDITQVVYNGTMYSYSNVLENIVIFIYYMLHPASGYLFALYADFELYPDNERFKRRLLFYTIPEFVNIFMGICSIWTGWFYVIDENNCYQRGSLFYVPTIISFGYILWAFLMILHWRKNNKLDSKMQRDIFTRLIIFPIMPCLGALLQMFIPGSTLTFPGTTLAILLNYITVQDSQMSRDHLTGLYNRGQLEAFMNYQLRNVKKGKYFFLILLDLDKFKHINDTWGHIVGDDALVQAAKILRRSCKRKEDYVARLGGDEFVIIGQSHEKKAVELIVERMHEETRKFNENGKKEYWLSFSAGYTIYDGSNYATLDILISEADQRMYEMKRKKKAIENAIEGTPKKEVTG